jgi:MFS family permease
MDNVRGPFYPDILSDFGVNLTSGSLFFALVSLASFASSLAGHRFVKGGSSIGLLIASTIGFSLGFIAIALAPTWPWMCVACGFFGVAFGGLNLSQNTLVLENAPAYNRRRMLNGLHSMYALAALVAPLVASLFRVMGLSWRMAFLVLAILPWVLLAGIGQFVKKKPKGHSAEFAMPLYPQEWKVVWYYALVVALYLWAEIAVSTRMVQWLRTDLGYGPNSANFLMSGFFALFLCGRLAFSVIHFPNLSNVDVLKYSSISAGVLMAAGLFLHPVFVVFSALAMAPFYPVAMDHINSRFGEKGSQALGFVIGFGSLSVVVMHLTLGWAAAKWGLTESLYFSAGGLFLVFAALMARSRFDTV